MSVAEQAFLRPLRTLHEVKVVEETAEALVLEIPVRLASKVLSILQPVLPPANNALTLYHLRRLVTPSHLPLHLQRAVEAQGRYATTKHLLIPPPLPIFHESIITALKPHMTDADPVPCLRSTFIPLHPPTTAEQAASWSENYWPCTFNPAAQTLQMAPPLNTLRSVLADLRPDAVIKYTRLSALVAKQCSEMKVGREVGAVVVDPNSNEVIAVAGDARWWPLCHEQRQTLEKSPGRPEHHALMRVIAMVAEKELQRRNNPGKSRADTELGSKDLRSGVLTNLEKAYLSPPDEPLSRLLDLDWLPAKQLAERRDGYLCHGLDVYVTHEPCVCCSMAMIHSRFRACIFQTRMPGTGGLCAETADGGLGYGLFWRKEVNWRVMTFQYSSQVRSSGNEHVFHA